MYQQNVKKVGKGNKLESKNEAILFREKWFVIISRGEESVSTKTLVVYYARLWTTMLRNNTDHNNREIRFGYAGDNGV